MIAFIADVWHFDKLIWFACSFCRKTSGVPRRHPQAGNLQTGNGGELCRKEKPQKEGDLHNSFKIVNAAAVL